MYTVAHRETAAYQQYKEQNTPKRLNIVRTVGRFSFDL